MPPSSSAINTVNWMGTWTVYKREVWRFLKVWNQTVIAPMVTTLLFLAIFSLALGGGERMLGGMPFNQFIAPGMMMMAIVQNAFANSSSSLILSKFQGVIIDLLMPPLSPSEVTFAMMMGGITRGFMVGIAVYVALSFFVPMDIQHPLLAAFYIAAASMMMALLGVLAGLWAQSFESLSAITNYVVTPLAFLSGTFYSVRQLPDFWYQVSHANPFFYVIDGIRYAITGYADGDITLGIIYILVLNILLWLGATWILRSGWRLKS